MRFLSPVCVFVGCLAANAAAQAPLTWPEVVARYKANNPTLRAGEIGIAQARADEITAYLRPNPDLSLSMDSIQIQKPADGSGRFDGAETVASLDVPIELRHKRGLRLASARGATSIAVSTQADLDRNQVLSLRTAFVQLLQAKAFLALVQDELADYDKVIAVGRDRFQAGDIAQLDLDRLQLQRVQYESDLQTATVNVRTAKIQLLQLMNDKGSVAQLDVTGPYDFVPLAQPLDDLRTIAFEARPDLKAALQAVDKAKVDYKLAVANGSMDPTFSVDVGWPRGNPSYFGVGLSVPLRIFDRNQGEKLKTKLDIERNERLAEAARLQVASDIDAAHATVMSTVALLKPYQDTYLAQATRVRDTVTFSYQRGGVALIDFLQAQQDYRTVQISYVNLIAAYLNAVAQLNFAIGREVVS